MGIGNREQDVSEQQEYFTIGALNNGGGGSALIATGATIFCSTVVMRPVTIQQAQVTGIGLSGAPQVLLTCLRFGTTSASFVIGTTTLIPAYGTSGFLPYSLGTVGDTRLNLQKGDLLVLQQLGGSATATTNTMMTIVVKNTQDFKTWF